MYAPRDGYIYVSCGQCRADGRADGLAPSAAVRYGDTYIYVYIIYAHDTYI